MSYYRHPYKVGWGYNHYPNGMTDADREKERELGHIGTSDLIIVISNIYPPDGSLSSNWDSIDGKTGQPVVGNELFKAWMMFTLSLARNPHNEIPEGKKSFLRMIDQTMMETMAGPTKH